MVGASGRNAGEPDRDDRQVLQHPQAGSGREHVVAAGEAADRLVGQVERERCPGVGGNGARRHRGGAGEIGYARPFDAGAGGAAIGADDRAGRRGGFAAANRHLNRLVGVDVEAQLLREINHRVGEPSRAAGGQPQPGIAPVGEIAMNVEHHARAVPGVGIGVRHRGNVHVRRAIEETRRAGGEVRRPKDNHAVGRLAHERFEIGDELDAFRRAGNVGEGDQRCRA